MEISKRRKWVYIAISVLVAILIWYSVSGTEEVSITVNDVPIEFTNADTVLAEKGLTLLSTDMQTVDLTLDMPRSLIYRFDPEDVRLVSNLASINATGTQILGYNIIYPDGIDASRITVRSPALRTITLEIGQLYTKQVEVRCKLVGSVADGYVAGSAELLPELLEVRGRQVDVMAVNYAQVTLNIENASETIVELLDFELYDFNNRVIKNEGIHPASEKIEVKIPVFSAKEIPLKIDFIEAPGVRLSSFDWSLDAESILLSGDAAELRSLDDEMLLASIQLEEITEKQSFVYDLEIPEGLENLSGINSVTLTIEPRDIATRTFEATSFSYENFSATREVSVVTSSLLLRLRGAESELDKIREENIRVVADLSDVADASGIYTVPANIYVGGDVDFGEVGTYRVTVRIGAAQ